MRSTWLAPACGAEDLRQGAVGLLTPGPTALGGRVGVLPTPTIDLMSGPVGPTPTASGSVAYAASHVAVPGLSSATEGTFLVPVDAQTLDVFGPHPPASQARNDLICVHIRDGAGGDYKAEPFSITGTPGSGADPALPSGSYAVLSRLLVKAASSYSGSPTITSADLQPVAPWIVARGGVLPVRSVTERAALTAYESLVICRCDLPGSPLEVYDGSTWQPPGGSKLYSYRNTVSGQTIKTGSSDDDWVPLTGWAIVNEVGVGAPPLYTGNGVWTVPVAGRWYMSARIAFTSSESGLPGSRQVRAIKNGVNNNVLARDYRAAAQNSHNVPCSFTDEWVLAAGDTITLQAYQSSGKNQTLDPAGGENAVRLRYLGAA